jgi:capsular polysaccharide biosynthesis protein
MVKMKRKVMLVATSVIIVAAAFALTLSILDNGFAASVMGLGRFINP